MAMLNSKCIIILGVIAFLIISQWVLYSMLIDDKGNMLNCPFMDNSTFFCDMNAFEHISQWKQIFSLIQQKNPSFYLIAFMVIIQIAVSAFSLKLYERAKYQIQRNYLFKYKPESKLFNRLQLAFSRGVAHPKIYV